MNRISRNLSLLWRTESLIVQRRATAVRKQMGLLAVAGLIAIFGLAMLGIAAFFALKPFVGEASAALIVGVADLVSPLCWRCLQRTRMRTTRSPRLLRSGT